MRGVAMVAVLLVATTAGATRPRPSVRRLTRQALAAYQDGRFGESLALLQRAWDLQPLATLRYDMALAYEQLGQLERALDSYRRVAAAPDSTPRQRQRADVKVGELVARLEHVATAAARPAEPGRPPSERGREPGSEPPPAPPPATTVAPLAAPAAAASVTRASPQAQAARRHWVAGAALGAVGAALLGAGLGLALDSLAQQRAFTAAVLEDDKRALRDRALAEGLASDVAYGVGAAALGVGASLLTYGLVERRRAARPALALVPWGGRGGVGLTLRGGF